MGINTTVTDHGVDLRIGIGAGRRRKHASLRKNAGKTKRRSNHIAVISKSAGSAKASREARAMRRQASHPAQSYGNTVIGRCPQPAKPQIRREKPAAGGTSWDFMPACKHA